jgi:hypothetical protein
MKKPAAPLTLVLTLTLGSCSAGEELPANDQSVAPEVVTAEVAPEEDAAHVVAAAFETPWPSGFTRQELADSAIAKTFAYLDQRTEGASDDLLKIVYQDTVLQVHQEWGTELAQLTIDSFADFLSDDTLLVVGTEGEFFVETLKVEGAALMPGFEQCCSSGVAGIAYKGTSWVSLPEVLVSEPLPGAQSAAIIPHELFHNVQDSLDKGPGSQVLPPGNELYRPMWLIEGSAEFIGFAITDYGGDWPYFADRFAVTGRDQVLAGEEDFLLGRYELNNGDYRAYTYGALATEYIIASVGVEPLMNIWKLAGQGASFENAFEEALGISVQDFYAAYDDMIVNMVTG